MGRWPAQGEDRYVLFGTATYNDLAMCATTSDHNMSRLVELTATEPKYPMCIVDVTSSSIHADEDEVCMSEAPPEDQYLHPECVWRSIRVVYGQREGQEDGKSSPPDL